MSVLVQRSVLGASGYPLDQIHIRGIAARGFHGVLQSEREAGQDFSADVTLYLDTRAAARGDDLAETVNYALVAEDVHAILSGEPVNLVETVAERIADAVLTHAQVISVDVTVHKPQAPIPLPFDDVVVTIHRDRVNVPVVSASTAAGAAGGVDDHEVAPSFERSSAHDERVDEQDLGAAPVLAPEPAPAVEAPTVMPSAAPVSVPQVRPIVISRVATNELPVLPPEAHAPAPAADSSGAVDVPFDMPPVPGPEETMLIPRQAPAPSSAPVRPPTPEEIAILEEQARVSAALRRPEVFGMTRITAGTRPDLVLDQTVVLSTTQAPVRAGAHHEPVVPEDLEPEPVAAEPAAPEPALPEQHDRERVAPETFVPETVAPESITPEVPALEVPALDTTTVLDPVEMLDRMDGRPDSPVDVVIALGGNLGEPQETLRQAVAELAAVEGIEIVAVGPLARTAAVGGPDQPDFLNTVVLATTTSSARELLHACQRIEHAHGRERAERWGPRTLDVDIIVYDGLIDSTDDLELPHPRAHERSFVLAPWAHVDPDALLPGLGGGPVGALAATAPDREGIRWLALDWLHESDDASEARRSAPPSIAPQTGGSGAPGYADGTERHGPTEASTLRE